MLKKFIFTLVLVFSSISVCFAEAPVFRARLGMYDLSVNAGELLQNEKFGAILTFQPGIFWNYPTMSSRIGVHFLADLKSNYGLMPVSGIGFSGFYYLSGVPSSYEMQPDQVLVEKTKPSIYTFASLTPINFNLNQIDRVDISRNISFSALLLDLAIGAGYEYPLKPNSILSADLSIREASGTFGTQTTGYRGFGFSITYTTSYY